MAATSRRCYSLIVGAAATNYCGVALLCGVLSQQRAEKSAVEALREARPPKEL